MTVIRHKKRSADKHTLIDKRKDRAVSLASPRLGVTHPLSLERDDR